MEKILFISYRFPPLDETSTLRSWAVAQYMKENGYYPIVVSRNWDRRFKRSEEQYLPSGETIRVERHDSFENHIIPFKSYLKYRLLRSQNKLARLLGSFYSVLDLVLMYLGIFKLNEYSEFIKYADKLVKEHPDIKKVLITGDPFGLYYIGYYLKRKYGIQWIADYRDEWSTMEFKISSKESQSLIHNLIYKIYSRSEQKWVRTASKITSVSQACVDRISNFVGVEGALIYNGFFEDECDVDMSQALELPKDRLNIVYNGTLYKQQGVELFLQGVKDYLAKYENKPYQPYISFIGAKYKEMEAERVRIFMKGYEDFYQCTDRIPKAHLYATLKNADVLLHLSHGKQYKGITSSKIFDHLAVQKPVLCVPSDGDVVEEILTKSGIGYFADNEDEVVAMLQAFNDKKEKGTTIFEQEQLDIDYIKSFTRKRQVKKMAQVFDSLTV